MPLVVSSLHVFLSYLCPADSCPFYGTEPHLGHPEDRSMFTLWHVAPPVTGYPTHPCPLYV